MEMQIIEQAAISIAVAIKIRIFRLSENRATINSILNRVKNEWERELFEWRNK